VEGVVGDSSKVHKGVNSRKYGTNPSADEHVYQLDLHVYHTTFPKFKYVPPNLVYVKIGTNIKTISATSHIFVSEQKERVTTKPTSPFRGGIGSKIIFMSIKIFVVPTKVITIEHVEGNIETSRENTKPIDTSTITNIVEPLEFLSTTLPLTPPQIGIGQDIILISSTPHPSKVFRMMIMTFDKTPN